MHGPCEGKGAAGIDLVGESLAIDKLHRNVERAVVHLTEVMNGNRVLVAEACSSTRLPVKPLDEVSILREVWVENFERDFALHRHLFGLIDRPHATFTEL